jgi:phosphate transport system substrate-binding protein
MKVKNIVCVTISVLLCGLVAASVAVAADRVKLKGSGASFPFPLYGQWFKAYSQAHRNVQIDYQAKGSGAGIKDFINKTVDVAASDAAMTDEDMAQVDVGVM